MKYALALIGVLPAVATAQPLPVPAQWPAQAAAETASQPQYHRDQVFADPRLARLLDAALAHNQDIAAALANLAAARAQYGIQRAAQFPEIDLGASYSHADGDGSAKHGDAFAGQATIPAWELDLFGRLRALSAASRAKVLASSATARGVRVSVIAQVATAWLTYGADSSLLAVARNTAAAARGAVDLTRRRAEGGIAPQSDLSKAQITLAQAEADIASQTTLVAQDANALRLLTGGDIAPADLPTGIEDAAAHLAAIPAGLPSDVLLRRPDVAEAEHNLDAAQANVHAARAALFPRISLTALAGFASPALAGLFSDGNLAWSSGGSLAYPLFAGGRLKSNLALAKAQQDAALATWRKAVEAAFRDVADVLARRATIAQQLRATTAARDAATDNAGLTHLRYIGGIATALDDFAARQTAYAAEKSLVATQLAEAASRVSLYRAVGGDDPEEK
ncbi:MAG: efflux transporter outer membrane subunit [Sphingomonadales bacterium]|nr:efflux transporter outer membrane subunit [Sphingomonadales bacterium]